MSGERNGRLAEALCARRDITDDVHEAQDVPCGPCFRDAYALLPFVTAEVAAAEQRGAERGWDECAAWVDANDPGWGEDVRDANPYRADQIGNPR